VHVVEARGVLQQVDDAYGVRVFPRIVDNDVRGDIEDRRVQIEKAVFGELHEGDSDERLADGADAEAGVRSDGRPALAVGVSDASGPLDTVVAYERDARAGHARLSQHTRGRVAKFLDGLRNRIGWRLRQRIRGRAAQRHKSQYGFHGLHRFTRAKSFFATSRIPIVRQRANERPLAGATDSRFRAPVTGFCRTL